MRPIDRRVAISLLVGIYQPSGNWRLPETIDPQADPHRCSEQVGTTISTLATMSAAEIDALARTLDTLGLLRTKTSGPRFDDNDSSLEARASRILIGGGIPNSKAILLVLLLLSAEEDEDPINTEAVRQKLAEFGIRPPSLTASLTSLRNRGAIIGEDADGTGLGFELAESGRDEITRYLRKRQTSP